LMSQSYPSFGNQNLSKYRFIHEFWTQKICLRELLSDGPYDRNDINQSQMWIIPLVVDT